MAGFVDSTVKDIDDRLKELQDEVVKLEAARAALVGTRRGPGRPPRDDRRQRHDPSGAPTRRRGPGRPRGRRGGNTRANQALELVRKQPGITIPQIADAMKIESNYLYRVMPKLVSEGLITRDGQGWYPAKEDRLAATGQSAERRGGEQHRLAPLLLLGLPRSRRS